MASDFITLLPSEESEENPKLKSCRCRMVMGKSEVVLRQYAKLRIIRLVCRSKKMIKKHRNFSTFSIFKFTKPEMAKWFSDKLTALLEASGIDSFKFDAGESSFSPADPALNATTPRHPLAVTTDYLNTIAKFGPMIEVRSGFRNQELPVYLRINDKDSGWFLHGLELTRLLFIL